MNLLKLKKPHVQKSFYTCYVHVNEGLKTKLIRSDSQNPQL